MMKYGDIGRAAPQSVHSLIRSPSYLRTPKCLDSVLLTLPIQTTGPSLYTAASLYTDPYHTSNHLTGVVESPSGEYSQGRRHM